jgi:hypothetical protein
MVSFRLDRKGHFKRLEKMPSHVNACTRCISRMYDAGTDREKVSKILHM